MPTFKHPCPHCAKYISRDVAACPNCGTRDPFAPARCPNCSTVIEDREWVACPKCGHELGGPPTTPTDQAAGTGTATGATPAQPAEARAVAESSASEAPADPGQPAPPARQREGAPQQANAEAGGRCTGCGAALPANARFCTVCGTLAA